MKILWRPTWSILALMLVTGCVSYPYETAFSSCDAEAGACYQYCEEFEGSPDYGVCHADCDASANQCFAGAYSAYQYSGASYGTRYSTLQAPPWYGRYGAWYPNSGYAFSFSYFDDGYGYGSRRRYRGRNYGYQGDGRGRYQGDRQRNRRERGDRRQGGNTTPPAQRPPRATPPPSRPPATPPPAATPPAVRPRPPASTRRGRRSKDFPESDIE